MENEEATAPAREVDADLVNEQSLAHPATPTTIAQLADHERGEQIVLQRIQILNTMRVASIQLTMPNDWVLFKNDAGTYGFLSDSGCDRIKKLWGIQIINLREQSRIEDTQRQGEFAYSIKGDGVCGLTGETVFDMEGIRYSTERYALEKPEGIQRTVAVQKAARANLDGGITRELAGMKQIPAEELTTAWKQEKNPWKTIEKCNLGRGFGSKVERQGAQAQQTDEIPVQFQPKCAQCSQPMKFVKAGVNKDNKPYAAFWSCPDRHETVKHEIALAEAERMKAEAAAKGAK